jgi:Xaa-Pro dipeptidase
VQATATPATGTQCLSLAAPRGEESVKVPFDAPKLDRLMAEAGLSLVLAHTRHNVRYLTGGYYYHFHANSTRMGRSQYLAFVGIPRSRVQEAFFVGRPDERGQMEAESLWIPGRIEAVRGTVTAAEGAVKALQRMGLTSGRIGVEMPFLPADAWLALRAALPEVELVDATPLLSELRAVKSDEELAILRAVYTGVAEVILTAFRGSRPGETTRDIARRVERGMAEREISFLFALVCAGPGFLRAPSSAAWEPGQVLHIDAGGTRRDYIADICRMGCIGEPGPLAKELHAACLEVQAAARSAIRAGVPCRDVLRVGEEAARSFPFGRYARFVVHSIGMVSYEEPEFSPDSPRPLEKNMVLSVETDFLVPGTGHVKIEDAVIVGETGCEGLGDTGREWQIV